MSDSGVLHRLLGIESPEQLGRHLKVGASWEGFALEQLVRSLPGTVRDVHFWATHSGGELDLLWEAEGRRYGVEFKYGDASRLTRSMRSALEDLGLESLQVVVPAGRRYRLTESAEVVPLGEWEPPGPAGASV